jgi:hypothetical protein
LSLVTASGISHICNVFLRAELIPCMKPSRRLARRTATSSWMMQSESLKYDETDLRWVCKPLKHYSCASCTKMMRLAESTRVIVSSSERNKVVCQVRRARPPQKEPFTKTSQWEALTAAPYCTRECMLRGLAVSFNLGGSKKEIHRRFDGGGAIQTMTEPSSSVKVTSRLTVVRATLSTIESITRRTPA